MVFKRADIYTSSGSVMLYNSWTPSVAKFDTSSFYNWEQDNLPLYDLEERTYEMWEQGGFPTSGITGLALTVSAFAAETEDGQAAMLANNNIFTNLSSCLAAIPKVVRFPVLVEVANFGDLGNLELHNIRIEEGGSIEIINRAYGKMYGFSGTASNVVTAPTYNNWHGLTNKIVSQDFSATLFSGLSDNLCTSTLGISTPVFSACGDIRASSVYSCLYPASATRQAPLTVGIQNSNMWPTSLAEHEFRFLPYEGQSDVDLTLDALDVSSRDHYVELPLRRRNMTTDAGDSHMTGSVYFNHLKKLSIKNCDGPIYIRNFMTDGENQGSNPRNIGVSIVNSDVLLENCGAVRCREAGFKFINSKVVLSRSAFAYRNYDLSSGISAVPNKGVGIHAVNSDVSISSLISGTAAQLIANPMAGDFQASGTDVVVCTSRNNIGIQLDSSKFSGGYRRDFVDNPKTGGITTSELNRTYGLKAFNSEIDMKGLFDFHGNKEGLFLRGCNVGYEDFCVDYHENTGLNCENSTATLNPTLSGIGIGSAPQARNKQVDFSGNGKHINLENQSTFTFQKVANCPSSYGSMFIVSAVGREEGIPQQATPAISISNSSKADFYKLKLLPRSSTYMTTNMPQYGLGVSVNKNSEVDFYSNSKACTFILGPPDYIHQHYVAGVYANNGSTIGLHGPTFIGRFGVDVLAENQSTINITPPRIANTFLADSSAFTLIDPRNHTSVELHSTRACLVVNKNSTLNMEDLGSFDNYWASSTQGVIALNTIGTDFQQTYNSFSLQDTIGRGSLQFFPNPQNTLALDEVNLDSLEDRAGAIDLNMPSFYPYPTSNQFLVRSGGYFNAGTEWLTQTQQATRGGVCVRATQDSVVNVTNVCFPVGTNTSPLDGPYYNASGTDCDQLMIWNIADTSRLNAAYCSVSGMYPADVGYHGPSAVWASAAGDPDGDHSNIPASGAPSSTPDTGRLSVLDAFGAGSSVWTVPSGITINMPFKRASFNTINANPANSDFKVDAGIVVSGTVAGGMLSPGIWGSGIGSYNNQGVFRLYFSPKSECKLLQNDLSGYGYGGNDEGKFLTGITGPAYQIFSQCYNMSANLSAVLLGDGNNVSGLYPNLLKLSWDSDLDGIPDSLWTSGFYYGSEFLDDNPSQCLLDESAANTFANSKHASLGMAGTPKRVTLYRARAAGGDNPGSEATEGDLSGTKGFKSANIFDLKRDN